MSSRHYHRRRFVATGVATYLTWLFVLVANALRRTNGTMVYALDDAAIHLSVAQNLAESGTWGVTAGQFESASSSPLWTGLLALFDLVLPATAQSWVPLLLNIAASIGVIVLLAHHQQVIAPARDNASHFISLGVLVTIVLFLPGLTIVGMEHGLHVLIALAILAMWRVQQTNDSITRRSVVALALLTAAGVLVRLETVFLVAGLASATVAINWPRRLAESRRQMMLVGTWVGSAGVALVGIAIANRLLGGGWLPNSILAKAQATSGASNAFSLASIQARLLSDPLLIAIFVVMVVLVWLRWNNDRLVAALALSVAVTLALHTTLASIGWFERYQAYLIALGTFVVLTASAAVPVRRRAPMALLVGLAVLLSPYRIDYSVFGSDAIADTFDQRYQAGQFLRRFYADQPVATGELGYISLLHRGPITDVLGLGDREVLTARRISGQHPPPQFWIDLAERRGFGVVVVYPISMIGEIPSTWIRVGQWNLNRPVKSALQPELEFWATRPDAVEPLMANLEAFQTALPNGVTLELNQLAGFQAAAKNGRP